MPLIRVPIGPDGPVNDLGLWIGRAAAHGLVAQTRTVPTPQTVRALIDTGADPRRVDIHDVRLAFGGVPFPPAQASWVELETVAVAPAAPSVLALVGRDMLAHCRFVYDGPRGELILMY